MNKVFQIIVSLLLMSPSVSMASDIDDLRASNEVLRSQLIELKELNSALMECNAGTQLQTTRNRKLDIMTGVLGVFGFVLLRQQGKSLTFRSIGALITWATTGLVLKTHQDIIDRDIMLQKEQIKKVRRLQQVIEEDIHNCTNLDKYISKVDEITNKLEDELEMNLSTLEMVEAAQ